MRSVTPAHLNVLQQKHLGFLAILVHFLSRKTLILKTTDPSARGTLAYRLSLWVYAEPVLTAVGSTCCWHDILQLDDFRWWYVRWRSSGFWGHNPREVLPRVAPRWGALPLPWVKLGKSCGEDQGEVKCLVGFDDSWSWRADRRSSWAERYCCVFGRSWRDTWLELSRTVWRHYSSSPELVAASVYADLFFTTIYKVYESSCLTKINK